MDNIDVVLYINLAHRNDRKEHITAQLQKVGVPESKVQRIDAIKRTPGMLGCILSHTKTMETFLANPEWKTAMVCEDDFTFGIEDLDSKLKAFFSEFPSWDAFNLAYHPQQLDYLDTHVNNIKKILRAITASCYIITRPIAQKLIEIWRIVAKLHVELGTHGHTANDVAWCSLQPLANWYVTVPAWGYQCDSYSDIINTNVAFRW